MTMILSIATPDLVVHASDRRVSLSRRGAFAGVFSALENKSAVFLCRDAVGAIGYTGTAFIGGQSTDEWIARNIAGDRTAQGAPHDFAFSMGRTALHRMRLRDVLFCLQQAMDAFPDSLKSVGLTIQITGFRIRRHRCIRFTIEIIVGTKGVQVSSEMRRPRNPRQIDFIAQVGDCDSIENTMQTVLDHAGQIGPGEDTLRTAAVRTIRDRATKTPTVGTDVMTISIPHPRISREIIWCFEPEVAHFGAIQRASGAQMFEAIYSPWVLTPSSIARPTIGTGGMDIQCGDYTFRCGNRPTKRPKGVLFASSSQRRKPAHR